MSDFEISLLVSAAVFVSAMSAMILYPKLPTHHRTNETRDIVRLGIGMISVLTSLVLGLLIASAKGTFDTTDQDMRAYAADFILLDQTLRDYGPEADGVRKMLLTYIDDAVHKLWPDKAADRREDFENPKVASLLDHSMQAILTLKPTSENEVWLRQRALDIAARLIRTRWALVVNQRGTISPIEFGIVVAWIMVIFASFGLNAPRNAIVVSAFFVCSLSIGAAVFLIRELDSPFDGMIMISPGAMQNAVAHLNR
jgi:hypothetical protein